jgi:hypothetical protein
LRKPLGPIVELKQVASADLVEDDREHYSSCKSGETQRERETERENGVVVSVLVFCAGSMV